MGHLGIKISKLKLMRYHIHGDTDLKFCMDVDMVHSNALFKSFFPMSTHLGYIAL